MTQDELEAKWVHVQASLDELGDYLAIRLRDVIGLIKDERYNDSILMLETTIESIEVFSGPGSTEDD